MRLRSGESGRLFAGEVDALFLAEVLNEARDVFREALEEARNGHLDCVGLLMEFPNEQPGVEIIEPTQECGWSLDFDLPGARGNRRRSDGGCK